MLLKVSTRIIYKATNVNGFLGMVIGAGITVMVQSSSITTSVLTPLVGVGVFRLEQMLPLTLGANIGTTMTAIMAAMVSDGISALQVALAHLFFNVTGIIIWYPIPFMRKVPLAGARHLGKATRMWKGFPLVYISVVFVLMPALFLGLSALNEQGSKGWTTLAVFLAITIIGAVLYTGFWFKFKKGKQKMVECFQRRERRRSTMEALPDDMRYLKAQVQALVEYTGMPDVEEATAYHEMMVDTDALAGDISDDTMVVDVSAEMNC